MYTNALDDFECSYGNDNLSSFVNLAHHLRRYSVAHPLQVRTWEYVHVVGDVRCVCIPPSTNLSLHLICSMAHTVSLAFCVSHRANSWCYLAWGVKFVFGSSHRRMYCMYVTCKQLVQFAHTDFFLSQDKTYFQGGLKMASGKDNHLDFIKKYVV